MSDPLSDPRAQGLLSADVGEISTLAGSFRRVAGQAQTAAAALRGTQNDATWTGAAATAFRSQVGKVPDDLDTVHESYGAVAAALDTYGTHLEPIQTQFRSLATQLTGARSSLGSAQGQLATARTTLSTATSAPHATSTTPAVVNAHTAVQSASGTVGRLQGEVSGLETRGFHLLDEFDTIRGSARSQVSGAGGKAPSHHWWQSVLHAVGNFVAGAAVSMVHDVLDLPHAIVNVVEHPGDLGAWGELVKDVAVTASIVVMVADPLAAPELLEADALADGGAMAAGEVAGEALGETAGGAAGDALSSAAGDAAGDAVGGADGAAGDAGGVLRGTNARGEVTSRGSFRVKTEQDAWDNAEPGPNGGKLCPTCKTEVTVPPRTGVPRDWDVSHNPSWTNREFPPNVTRPEVLDNYQQGTSLECPSCNRSGGNDDSRFPVGGLP
ncbi:MAG: hypothetical protein J2P43_13110 [Candidatus Dormibacteraeota bacterium]|nr:hypothetical protein [Candidatus Dormibacteraeota bacterium]